MVTTETRIESTTAQKAPAGANGDNRYKILEATMKRYQYQPGALIEVLHTAQQVFGYLEESVLLHIAHKLKAPPSRVYGVATFYELFSLKPKGRHTCVVCMGTACYVKGGGRIIDAVGDLAGIKSGETTPDGNISLLTVRCIGACGIAPAAVLDGTVHGHATVDGVMAQVKGWMDNGH